MASRASEGALRHEARQARRQGWRVELCSAQNGGSEAWIRPDGTVAFRSSPHTKNSRFNRRVLRKAGLDLGPAPGQKPRNRT